MRKNRIMKTKMETKEKETDSNIKIYDDGDIQIEYNYSSELLAGICVLIFGLVVMVILMTVLCLCL